jgi:hypothetical protein
MVAVQQSVEVTGARRPPAITPQEFVTKWGRDADLNEKQGSQHHFLDLCDMLGVQRPPPGDGNEDYTFERSFPGLTGRVRFADVWRRGCFGWEYKRPGKSLVDALDQLLRYAFRLDNPPLLVVTDRQKFEIHTHYTGFPTRCIAFSNRDLLDPRIQSQLRAVFDEPYSFRPPRDSRHVTETVAASVVKVADMLRDAGVPPADAAHFLCQYVFCCFAEDIGLMKDTQRPFKRLLTQKLTPKQLQSQLTQLFDVMRQGGSFGADQIPWFNGGLYDSIKVPLLPPEAVRILADAAEDRWDAIDAGIFGTLFQRGLDPARRAQHGAFYTNPSVIERLVTPVVQDTLLREWDQRKREINGLLSIRDVHSIQADHTPVSSRRYRIASKANKARKAAQDVFDTFLERLRNFRALDPACGSGNFLYFALKAIKDVEKQVHNDAPDLGLTWQFAVTGVQNVLGIEVDPYAAELARMTVWIGELQWRVQNGYGWEENPILRNLEHIECRDAVLDRSETGGYGRGAPWPAADVIIGNPPFVGNKKMREDLGEEYTVALRRAYSDELTGGVDFVCYWFHKALKAVNEGRCSVVGLVSTQAVRRGSNRAVLDAICAESRIFRAWSDEPWVNEGAAVRVSLVCFGQSDVSAAMLDGSQVQRITADLAAVEGVDLTDAEALLENQGFAFQGPVKVGSFDVDGDIARGWLMLPNPHGRSNADVLKPWANGKEITERPKDKWIIDYASMDRAEAAMYEAPFAHVQRVVKPQRDKQADQSRKKFWWRHGRTGTDFRLAITGRARYIATVRVAKHRFFVWMPSTVWPDSRLFAIALDDDASFGILSSRIHEVWALATASKHGVGNDPTYNAESCFETFPFPRFTGAAGKRIEERIEECARELVALRSAWLNPPEWTHKIPEIIPVGMRRSPYPTRVVPKKGYEQRLRGRTMTKLYNERPAWLSNAHRALDSAVAAAYGWKDYSPDLADAEILRRLYGLNAQRAAISGD